MQPNLQADSEKADIVLLATQLQDQINERVKKAELAETQVHELTMQQSGLERRRDQLKEDIRSLSTEFHQLEAEHNQQSGKYSSKIVTLKREISILQDRHDKLQQAVKHSDEAQEDLQRTRASELSSHRTQLEAIQADIKSAQDELDELKTTKEADIFRFRKAIDEHQESLRKVKYDTELAEAEAGRVTETLENHKTELEKNIKKLSTRETELRS